jgi:hypothetical protein
MKRLLCFTPHKSGHLEISTTHQLTVTQVLWYLCKKGWMKDRQGHSNVHQFKTQNCPQDFICISKVLSKNDLILQIKLANCKCFLGEFGFPSLQNVLIQPESNEKTVLLPCPTTDPGATVGLYKVASLGVKSLF